MCVGAAHSVDELGILVVGHLVFTDRVGIADSTEQALRLNFPSVPWIADGCIPLDRANRSGRTEEINV